MLDEPLRFRKSSFSGGQSECVEIAHNLQCLRDSKNPNGLLLQGDVRALIDMAKANKLAR